MSFNTQNNFTISSQCGEDLSLNQFQFVTLAYDNTIYAARNTDIANGVLTDVPSLGPLGQYSGTVVTEGITRICVLNAYPIGTFLVPYFDGTTYGVGASVADAGSQDQYIRARTLQASTAAYDVVACELLYNPYGDAAGAQGLTGLTGLTGSKGITGANGIATIATMVSVSAAAGLGITGPHVSPTSYVWANLNGVTGVFQFYATA
jgi:hypothetical protein